MVNSGVGENDRTLSDHQGGVAAARMCFDGVISVRVPLLPRLTVARCVKVSVIRAPRRARPCRRKSHPRSCRFCALEFS